MTLQQSLIDLFIVSVIAALTPIVAGLLSRLRVLGGGGDPGRDPWAENPPR